MNFNTEKAVIKVPLRLDWQVLKAKIQCLFRNFHLAQALSM
jgi:hypothetical protein